MSFLFPIYLRLNCGKLKAQFKLFLITAYSVDSSHLGGGLVLSAYCVAVATLQALGETEMQISLAKPPSENRQKEKRKREQQQRMMMMGGRGYG